jgi:hypothetical protein
MEVAGKLEGIGVENAQARMEKAFEKLGKALDHIEGLLKTKPELAKQMLKELRHQVKNMEKTIVLAERVMDMLAQGKINKAEAKMLGENLMKTVDWIGAAAEMIMKREEGKLAALNHAIESMQRAVETFLDLVESKLTDVLEGAEGKKAMEQAKENLKNAMEMIAEVGNGIVNGTMSPEGAKITMAHADYMVNAVQGIVKQANLTHAVSKMDAQTYGKVAELAGLRGISQVEIAKMMKQVTREFVDMARKADAATNGGKVELNYERAMALGTLMRGMEMMLKTMPEIMESKQISESTKATIKEVVQKLKDKLQILDTEVKLKEGKLHELKDILAAAGKADVAAEVWVVERSVQQIVLFEGNASMMEAVQRGSKPRPVNLIKPSTRPTAS